jgi:phosphinothricin acetyltransferase
MRGVTKPLIRPATTTDIPALTAIYAEAVLHGTATFEIEPPPEKEVAARLKAITDAGYPYIVADAEARVVGYAYAGPYRPRIGYRHTVEDSVYLAESARHQGIGGALLGRLIAVCEEKGFRQMIACIGDSANVASIRLHAAAGFEHTGRFPNVGYKFGRWLDTVFMQRALGQGSRTAPTR